MGKHGGRVELFVRYRPHCLLHTDAMPGRKASIRASFSSHWCAIWRLLQTPTADGFAFRVDLRLRPDPGATQVASRFPPLCPITKPSGKTGSVRSISRLARLPAIWRRVKIFCPRSARLWRRYYDFAAIEDVHSMKRQIHAVRGHGDIAVRGHNLKLGRGGIREIEFFVQTQQLIAGARSGFARAYHGRHA